MEMTPEIRELLNETKASLSGYKRRHFMAQIVKTVFGGSPTKAHQELGWNRGTLSKALQELEGGFCYIDRYYARGRKRAEEHLPNLLDDIRELADRYSQTDPTLRTTQQYTRLTSAALRQQLIEEKGYPDAELPTEETIRQKLNALGYGLKRVKKSRPVKKIPQTDAIFDQIHQVNQAADADESKLRLSLDAKAPIRMGLFSRGGLNRVVIKGLDHDFPGQTPKVIPFGVYLPHHGELYLYFTASKLTSDFIVDCLSDFWAGAQDRFPTVTTLVLNQDNGPETHSRRTQFMQRITQFVDHFQIAVQLAYYPPYHSKYNPIERVWGFLEQHWNGSLLDSVETILHFARSFSFRQVKPVVQFVSNVYRSGVKLSQKQMRRLEQRFQRLEGLEKWFVLISPLTPTQSV